MFEEQNGISNEDPLIRIETPASESDSRSMVLFTVAGILAILSFSFFVFYKYYTAAKVSDKNLILEDLQGQLSSKENLLIENRVDSINSALTIVKTASKTKYQFYAFMNDLASKITSDVKIDNLSIDNNGSISIDGKSKSYRSVADLALAIGSSKKIQDVQIVGISESIENGSAVVSFSMTCNAADWKVSSVSQSGGQDEQE